MDDVATYIMPLLCAMRRLAARKKNTEDTKRRHREHGEVYGASRGSSVFSV
jgi:hypothetical protein